ncbi:MAG: hypothetical protein L0229_25420 [Blastocatellia bacterium]|nr:hypothetical protein [Blastocatellia bacterium]
MRLKKQKLAPIFALLFAAMLVLPALSAFRTVTVEALAQDGGSASDVPQTAKPPRGPRVAPPKGGALPPANDDCAGAVNVTGADCPFTDTVDTAAATDEVDEPQSTCTVQANSIWYNFTTTAPEGAIVTVSTCNSAPFDTALMVWRPDGTMCDFANFTPIACNDDACGDGFQSFLTFFADPGVTYKIQAGGFDGETGTMIIDIDCVEIVCPDIPVNGTLGSGSPDWPFVTGLQTPNRIFRDGIASTCAVPKVCPGTFGSGSFNFDAYTFTNETADPQCVTVNFDPNAGGNPGGVNLHAVAYLGTYEAVVCTNYLADVGSSVTQPFSFTVPGGSDFVVVIVENTAGTGLGQTYSFTVVGNICQPFDCCVQSDNGNSFILFSSETGDYIYQDCSKGVTLEGTGVVGRSSCKVTLMDTGADPKRPDRFISVVVNKPDEVNQVCTFVGTADIRLTHRGRLIRILDSDVRDSTCECPGAGM